MASLTVSVVAGLGAGVALVALFAIIPISGYPVFSESQQIRKDADYTPLLQLQIMGLRDSYKVGEGVNFAVGQIAGGYCDFPEHVMIKDLETGRIVREWDGKSTLPFCGRVSFNPATSGATWTTSFEEKPIIFNQTGSYVVVAKHLFKTVQKEFKVTAIQDGNDTSPQAVAILQSRAGELDIVKTLLAKYPSANSVVTANYHSKLFEEFQKYHPHGIVQYHVAKTEPQVLPSTENGREGRSLTVTIIFDRYYENNTMPLVLVQCTGENYSSLSVGEPYVEQSKIDSC